MSTNPTVQTTNRRKILGTSLLIAGSVVMLGYLGLLGSQITAFLDASPANLLGSYMSLGLTSLRLVPYLAFDHAALFSLTHRMLVLFSAFVVSVAGLALFAKSSRDNHSGDRSAIQAPGKGAE
jgi:hypothetical protein